MKELRNNRLSKEQVHQYHNEGYLHPFTSLDSEDMVKLRPSVEAAIATEPSFIPNAGQCRHLDRKLVYDLCSHPAILDVVSSILGNDVVLWRSQFFYKKPGAPGIPWHQDTEYWPIEPSLNISAWLAFEEVDSSNGCVQIVPGSHKKLVPHIQQDTGHSVFQRVADPSEFDAAQAVNMVLKPGEFFVFNEKTLHYSDPIPADSNRTRMGVAIRYTTPMVQVNHHKVFPGHKSILVRGIDSFQINEYANPPVS